MTPLEPSQIRLAFGPFELNVAAGEMRKSGVRIRLSNQPFRILLMLLAHPGEVVTREELREAIWEQGTFVDFEHGLHAATNKLRRALGDSAENPRYIETVPGRGYRFIGHVDAASAAPAAAVPQPPLPESAQQSPATSHGKPLRHRWAEAAVILALAVLAGWALLRPRPPAAERIFSLQLNPPDGSRFASGANDSGMALSPDGKTAAFIATDKGRSALWVQRLDAVTARRIPGTEGAGLPFWSPDSQSVAFFALGKLQRVDLAGGAPQVLCEVGLAPGGAWGSDGRILFGGWGAGIFQVPVSGGQPSPLTTLDASRGEIFHYWPQVIPGGNFLYFARSGKRENTGVYVASLANPRKAVQVLASDTNALYAPAPGGAGGGKGYLLWLRGSALVAQEFDAAARKLSGQPRTLAEPAARNGVHGQMQVAVSAAGILLYAASNPALQFTWVDRAGKRQGAVGEPAAIAHFRISPDGRQVLATRIGQAGADLWMLDVERGVWNRFSSRPGINIYPVWSGDGRNAVFASDAPFNLYRRDARGVGGELRLTESPNPQFPMDWSRDGRFILYEEDTGSGTKQSLWILPMAQGDAGPRPYLRSAFNETMGRFSPDTRWIAFQSDESGRYEVYIDSFPEAHGKVRISTSGGILPQWGAGGRELFFVSPDATLMSVRLKPQIGNLETSAPQPLFPLSVQDPDVKPYDLAPGGQRFLVLEVPEYAAHPLTVIVNWPALLNHSADVP